MNFGTDFPEALFRATILLMASGLLVTVFLRMIKPHSVRLHRAAWIGVLLNGMMLAPLTVELPWLEAQHTGSLSSADQAQRATAEFDSVISDVDALPILGDGELESSIGQRPAAAHRLRSPDRATTLAAYAQVIWLTGICVLCVVAIVTWGMLMWLLRRCPRISERYQQETDQIAAEMGLSRSVPVIVHDSIGPLLCLTLRGYRIVIPDGTWSQLTALQRQAVLRHELAHRQRHDVLKSLAARVLVFVHWFNPFAWWAARRFDEAAEWACDETLAHQPKQVAALASALLEFVERKSTRQPLLIGASAVRGAPLCARIRRLLNHDRLNTKEPLMKRVSILSMIVLIIAAGAFRLQLVAQSPVDRSEEDNIELTDLESWRRRARTLAQRLDAQGNRAVDELRTTLGTEPGLIVLQDRVGHRAEEARRKGQENLVANHLKEHFNEAGNEYELQNGQQEYRASVLERSERVNNKIESIRRVLRKRAERLKADTEVEKLLLRFIESDAAAVMLFMQAVDGRIEPSADELLSEVGGLFLVQADGTVSINPANRDRAQQQLELSQYIDEKRDYIVEEISAWLADFSEMDELHKTVRAALQHPLFPAAIMSSELELGAGSSDVDHHVEEFFRGLEELTVDNAEGLVLRTEARDEVSEYMREFQRMARAAEVLRNPLNDLAERFSTEDKLNQNWKGLLVSGEVIRIRLAHEFEAAGLEAGDLVEQLVQEVLEEAEDGSLRVRSDRQEELQEHIQEMFAEFRGLRRGARKVNRLTQRIADSDLREAFNTWGGRICLKSELEKRMRRLAADGLELWLMETFEEKNGRLTLREEAEEEITEFLADVDAVTRELNNDDFQRSNGDVADDDRDESDR